MIQNFKDYSQQILKKKHIKNVLNIYKIIKNCIYLNMIFSYSPERIIKKTVSF